MIKLSKKVEYALIAMIYMSEKDQGKLTTARELSQQFNIPSELLGKVLQHLARKGLIVSVQGVKGGYQLPRPLDQISLAEVITSVDGPIQLVNCGDPVERDCEQFDFCNIRSPMEQIQSSLFQFLNQITLKDLQQHHWQYVGMPTTNAQPG